MISRYHAHECIFGGETLQHEFSRRGITDILRARLSSDGYITWTTG